jgi:hypothetical protein
MLTTEATSRPVINIGGKSQHYRLFVTPFCKAAFPSLDTPEPGFGSVPSFKSKLVMTESQARAFMTEARVAFAQAFPEDAPTYLPIQSNGFGNFDLTAETLIRPVVTSSKGVPAFVKAGDMIQVTGRIIPFKRPKSAGVQFQIRSVDVA